MEALSFCEDKQKCLLCSLSWELTGGARHMTAHFLSWWGAHVQEVLTPPRSVPEVLGNGPYSQSLGFPGCCWGQSSPETGGHRVAKKEEATSPIEPKEATQPGCKPLRARRRPGRHGLSGVGVGGLPNHLLSVTASQCDPSPLPSKKFDFDIKHILFAHF